MDPQAAADTAQSMVDDYAPDRQFPKWSEDNGETYVMVGDPADAILADYYAFGAPNFNTSTALADMVAEATATQQHPARRLNYLDPARLPADERQLRLLQLLRPGVHHAGVQHRRLRAVRVRRRARRHRRPDRRTQPRPGLAQHAQPGSGFDPAARRQRHVGPAASTPTSGTDFVEADSWIYTGMVPFNIGGLATAKGGDAAHEPPTSTPC